MSLILRQIIGYQQGRKSAPTTTNPLLKSQLDQANKDLNSILKKWKFGDQPIKTSQEFLNQFEPWINSQLEKQKQLKVFLAKKGVTSLEEATAKLANRDLSESEELENLNQELITLKRELQEKTTLWQNTEQDYLERIGELLRTKSTAETPEDYEELITEKDQLSRDKGELQQEVLSLNNKLKLKHQEVQTKEKSLETLKKEKDKQEISLNKKITEKNSLITTLQREVNQLKEKYSKQSKLLDEEQLESKKLEDKIGELEQEVSRLTTALIKEVNKDKGGILE